jgi:aminopeptidase N
MQSTVIPCPGACKSLPLPCCSGAALGTETVLRVTQAEQEFVFEDVEVQPVPSLLRGFSGAPSGAGGQGLACWWPHNNNSLLLTEHRSAILPRLADGPSHPTPTPAAPVHMTVDGQTDEDLLHILAHDTGVWCPLASRAACVLARMFTWWFRFH